MKKKLPRTFLLTCCWPEHTHMATASYKMLGSVSSLGSHVFRCNLGSRIGVKDAVGTGGQTAGSVTELHCLPLRSQE